jgi:hypothetical protein
VTRRRGRKRKQLLDDLGDRRGYSHLKEGALDRVKWRNRFGRGCGPVVWQITDEWIFRTCGVQHFNLMTWELIHYLLRTDYKYDLYEYLLLKIWSLSVFTANMSLYYKLLTLSYTNSWLQCILCNLKIFNESFTNELSIWWILSLEHKYKK